MHSYAVSAVSQSTLKIGILFCDPNWIRLQLGFFPGRHGPRTAWSWPRATRLARFDYGMQATKQQEIR